MQYFLLLLCFIVADLYPCNINDAKKLSVFDYYDVILVFSLNWLYHEIQSFTTHLELYIVVFLYLFICLIHDYIIALLNFTLLCIDLFDCYQSLGMNLSNIYYCPIFAEETNAKIFIYDELVFFFDNCFRRVWHVRAFKGRL